MILKLIYQVYEVDQLWISRPPLILCCIFALCVQFGFLELGREQENNQMLEQMMEKEYQQFEITRENMDVIKTRRWTFFRCAITQWATGIWRCIISCRRFFEAASMEKRKMPSSGR